MILLPSLRRTLTHLAASAACMAAAAWLAGWPRIAVAVVFATTLLGAVGAATLLERTPLVGRILDAANLTGKDDQ